MNDHLTKSDLIERAIDKGVAGAVSVATEFGGLRIQNMLEVMEMAKLMALSQQAVPSHLRNNPGMCLAVCLSALEWKMSPFAVANKTYVTGDRLNYESQLVHAVIEARAPLVNRLEVRYEGEDESLVCIVSGTFRGEMKPREHRSPMLKDARPRRNSDGVVKGSPLWTKKPAVQLFYDTSRDFCRIYCPDVLLGIYTPDEVEQHGIGDHAKDVTDEGEALSQRLAEAAAQNGTRPVEGFSEHGHQEALGEAQDEGVSSPKAKGQKRTSGRPKGSTRQSKRKEAGSDGPTEPRAAPSVGLPQTPEQYAVWVDAWLGSAADVAQIEQRWVSERKLRNACGLIEEQRVAIRNVVEERIKGLTP